MSDANKQDTVTTSTTEAELLALAQAEKEVMFITRLINELEVTLDTSAINIRCDNKQTTRSVQQDIEKLQTKLRHVNIHNHWLGQEPTWRATSVEYIKTEDMIADGLTKALTNTLFSKFTEQLELVDIQERLEARKDKDKEEAIETVREY